MKKQRYYQLAMTDAARQALQGRRGCLIVSATGTGKTVVFSNLAKMVLVKGKRVLILLNRNVLCQQAAQELVEFDILPQIEQANRKASPGDELQAFLGAELGRPPDAVIVGSVDTMQGERLHKWTKGCFDLIICDEAHYSAARTWKAVLDHLCGPSTKVVGFTATPVRHDGKSLWKGFEVIAYQFPILTCENEDGKVLLGAVEDGWLVRPTFTELPVPVTLSEKAALAKGELSEEAQDHEYNRDGHLRRVFEAASEAVRGFKSLYFWCSTASSKLASEIMRGNGIEARHIDCYMSQRERAEIIGDISQGIAGWFNEAPNRVLCNCKLLGVGYNQPDIELVGIGAMIKSATDYCQTVGRVTRVICNVDDCGSSEERRALITASAKPIGRVVDMSYTNREHNLATAACLITSDPEEVAYLTRTRGADGVGPVDLDEMREKLRAKRTDDEKQLTRQSEMLANAARVHHASGSTYNPDPATEKQRNYLRYMGYAGPIHSKAHAGSLIGMMLRKRKISANDRT